MTGWQKSPILWAWDPCQWTTTTIEPGPSRPRGSHNLAHGSGSMAVVLTPESRLKLLKMGLKLAGLIGMGAILALAIGSAAPHDTRTTATTRIAAPSWPSP